MKNIPIYISLVLVSMIIGVIACATTIQAQLPILPTRPNNWAVTLYRNDRVIALEHIATVYVDTETGEMVAVDHEGYTWVETMQQDDIIEVANYFDN